MKRQVLCPKYPTRHLSSFIIILILIIGLSMFIVMFSITGIANAESVIATIPVSFPVWATYDPDNGKIYVSEGNANIAIIDGSTNTVIGNIPAASPFGSVFSPVDHMIYVANYFHSSISQIDPSTNTVVATISLSSTFVGPEFIAINSINGMLYVGTAEGSVYVVNPSTHAIVTTIPVNFPVGGMAFNPFNGMVYVTLPQNTALDSVGVIDTSTNSLVTNIPVAPAPFGVTVNPSNGKVYVASEHAAVTVIDGPTNAVTATIIPPTVPPYMLGPHPIRFDPDNGKVYVVGLTGLPAYLFAIDSSTDSIIGSPILVSNGIPHEIAYDSSNGNLYLPNWTPDTVSVVSTSPSPQTSPICSERDVQHWDKIVFSIVDPVLAKKLNFTLNSELDVKVLDDPHKVADIKQKVLDFLHVPNASKTAIKIVDVGYAISCGTLLHP
jgi:YVTN family beta-propeller protein